MIFYFSFSTLFAQKEKLSVGSNFAILLSSEFSSKFGVNFRSEYHLLDYFSLLGNYTICGGTSYLNSKKNSATIYSGDIHLLDFGFKYYFF